MSFPLKNWLSQGVLISHDRENILIGLGNLKWSRSPQEQCISFYFPDFFLTSKTPWLLCEQVQLIPITEVIKALEQDPSETEPAPLWEPPSKELFKNGFNAIQTQFETGRLDKMVLYGFSHAAESFCSSRRRHALVSVLKDALEFPINIYGFWGENQEGILGATPEILFHQDKGSSSELQTMALAGTQKRSLCRSSMKEDPKLVHEHTVVVQDIRNRLSALGKVNTSSLQTMSLPLLTHLCTPICVHLHSPAPFSTLVETLHPTPALGGFPHQLAIKWLKEYSLLLPRGRFGAPVGFLNSLTGEKKCYVAIRNVTWDAQGLSIGAGCGIVRQSSMEEEWEELMLKTESIKRFLGL